MKNYNRAEILISGVGVTSAIGQGKEDFVSGLLQGKHAFEVMKRPGRQIPHIDSENEHGSPFLGAEISSLTLPDSLPRGLLRTASFSSQVALASLHEAWNDANLNGIDPVKIGLVVGGSNFQQREIVQTQKAFHERLSFLRPAYAFTFLDSDLCGLCTEYFGIKGLAFTIGGASASGQVAILRAAQAVQSGEVDFCIGMGALMDLSYWELQGFRNLGAMGPQRFTGEPALACRPFDKDRDGFIYGESCGAVVVERADSRQTHIKNPYARISGWAMTVDGNRNPNSSLDGEVRVIEKALSQAGLKTNQIDYINSHGTGSVTGDQIEVDAFSICGLNDAFINATKSLTGHGLSSAGAVEVIATLLQMKAGFLHPTKNLENPVEPVCNWVSHKSISHEIKNSINMSMGFGGINTAICLQKY